MPFPPTTNQPPAPVQPSINPGNLNKFIAAPVIGGGQIITNLLPPASAVAPGTPAFDQVLGPVYSDGVSWLSLLGASVGGVNNGVANLTAQNTGHLRAAIARVRTGSGIAKIAVIGDSTTMGAFSNGVVFAGNKPLAFPAQMASQMSAKGLPSTNCSWFGSGNVAPATAAGYTAYNPAVTFPIAGFAPGSILTLGAFPLASTTNGATLTYTPENAFAFDTVDIYFLGGVPAGTFNVNVDGGASLQTVVPGAAHTVQVVTITGIALATHAINIVTNTASPTFITGMVARASGTKRVEVYDMGWSAAVVLNPAALGASYATPLSVTNQYVYFNALPVVAPDLTIIHLTINDINNQTATPAVYQAALQTMVVQALVSGDCLLMVGNPGNTAAWTGGIVAPQYQAAVYAVAAALGIPVVDITKRWTSYAVTNPVMPFGDAGAGAIHPSTVGNGDVADAILSIFPI